MQTGLNAARDWLVPLGLIGLAFIPVAAGAARLYALAGGTGIPLQDIRFVADPAPIVIHIVGVCVLCLVGSWQFAPGFRNRHSAWHRRAGRLTVAAGIAAAASGLWLTFAYPPVPEDGALLTAFRIGAGLALAGFLLLGLLAARRRDFARHRAWMIRGFAVFLGTGTQALLFIPWTVAFGAPGETGRALLMGSGWLLTLLVAEWIVQRRTTANRFGEHAAA